jgi:hypothetical protein
VLLPHCRSNTADQLRSSIACAGFVSCIRLLDDAARSLALLAVLPGDLNTRDELLVLVVIPVAEHYALP